MNLEQTYKFWLQSKDDLSLSSIQYYNTKYSTLKQYLGATTVMESITPDSVDSYIQVRQLKEACRNTITKELGLLTALLYFAKRKGWYSGDLNILKPKGFGSKYNPKTRVLTNEEVAQLPQMFRPEYLKQLYFILGTGARLGEVRSARVGDVRKETVLLRGTKTALAYREIPILDSTRRLIEVASDISSTTLGNTMFLPWPGIHCSINDACAKYGMPHFSPNDLRRTFATRLVEKSGNLYAVSKMLGHANTAMVQKVYGRPDAKALGELLNG